MTPVGIEPTTPRLKVECSKPAELRSHYYCGADGLRSRSSGFSVQCNDHICHNSFLGERRGSNPRQLEPQSSTLPLSYNHHIRTSQESRTLSIRGFGDLAHTIMLTCIFCSPAGSRTRPHKLKAYCLPPVCYEGL